MNNNTYSLIIPVLNRLETLKLMYDSIESEHEINTLLIDNGSEQETVNYLNKISGNRNTYITLDSFNKGASYARNAGLSFAFNEMKSTGAFFIDSDIVLGKNCLDYLIETNEKENKAIVFSNSQNREGFSYREFLEEGFKPKINSTVFTTTECCYITKEVYQKVGNFDDMYYPCYCEDMDYFYRAKLKGYKLINDPKAYHYHFGDQNPSKDPEFETYKAMRFAVVQDYYTHKWGGTPGHETYTKPFNTDIKIFVDPLLPEILRGEKLEKYE